MKNEPGLEARRGAGILDMTRRGFIGAAVVAPLAARADCSFPQPATLFEDEADLDVFLDDQRLMVSINHDVTPERARFWNSIGIGRSAFQSWEPTPDTPTFWEIETARFGPNARFRLRVDRIGVRRRWRVFVDDLQYGRIKRQLSFIFEQWPVADADGAALLASLQAQVRQNPPSPVPPCDAASNEALLSLGRAEAPPRRVFTVAVDTTLWSLSSAPTEVRAFMTEPPRHSSPERVLEGRLRLATWIADRDATLEQIVDAGRVTSTLQLIFNGQVGFAAADRSRNATVAFDRKGEWRISPQSLTLSAMSPGVPLGALKFGWRPANEGAHSAEDAQDGPAPAFKLTGEAEIAAGALAQTVGFVIPASVGPGLRLNLSESGQMPRVQFRVLDHDDVEGGSVAEDKLRSEASVLADWQEAWLTGAAAVAAGPFKRLSGRLMERVDAPRAADNFNHARLRGDISFTANFTGSASRHWRVMTPIGPIGFRGPAPEECDASKRALEEPFRSRSGDQFQAVWTWDANSRGDGSRDRPRARWAEVNGVLREAAVTMADADTTRLTFAPTPLTLVYTPETLAAPLASYIRLAAPEGAERAQLDLGDAALRVSRGADLAWLTFRFADLGLSFRGGALELVRKNAVCTRGTQIDGAGRPVAHDTRPILVVEFPGQHLFEEAFFIPRPEAPPDVIIKGPEDMPFAMLHIRAGGEQAGEVTFQSDRVQLGAVESGGWILDPNDRVQVSDVLRLLSGVDARAKFRSALQTAKKELGKDTQSFTELSDGYEEACNRVWPRLPGDQKIYVGPFALDPDAMRLVTKLWRKQADGWLDKQATGLLDRVKAAADKLTEEAKSNPALAQIAGAPDSFEAALALEQLLEAQFPPYQLFRSAYRERMIDAFIAQDDPRLGAVDLSALNLEAIHSAWRDGDAPAWVKQAEFPGDVMRARRNAALAAYKEALKGSDTPKTPARARLAQPSRLAFRVRCRDGIEAARLKAPGLDTPLDTPASQVRDILSFSLASLTRFSDFELSVVRRAETIYRTSESGRTDLLGKRKLDLSQGARLDHLGFTDGDFVSAERRLGEIVASMAPPGPLETAIELPARLTLSPDQNAVVVTTGRPVPEGVFTRQSSVATPRGARPFMARFLVDEVDPNLRAIHSPDLRADALEARLQERLVKVGSEAEPQMRRFPGAGAPPRGPLAPWHLGPHKTQTIALGEDDVELLRGRPALVRLLDYLTGVKARRDATAKPDLKFRASLDAYARHEIVLLSSAWGLPVLGKRSESGAIMPGSSQAEAERRHRLIDIQEGSAVYVPRTLGVIELALCGLGGTLRHASSFEPPAAARDFTDLALFEAMSVESWQHWANFGRDIYCEVVYKGFLWPIGQRASLVQVTERDFFVDRAGAIRAILRQRLFIRVGKAEKIYPALKQPAQGRRFPVDRLRNLTAQTPDIVDPSDTTETPPSEREASNGRIMLGDASKGLVFWPRTARLAAANVRFELDIDGALTDLPLIFVDNVAANDEATLAALAGYYQDLPTPDPLGRDAKQDEFDPLRHVRTLDMGGGKHRYAPEDVVGSASVETQLWTLCGTGLEREIAPAPFKTGQAELLRRDESDFRSDPLLQGADQPPFYPALECVRIRLRQAERLIGGPLESEKGQVQDPRWLRAMPDGRYVAHGLPSRTPSQDATVAVKGNETEMYLALIDQPRLSMGGKGDNSGGVFRPSGHVVGLSRARGVMTWRSTLLTGDPPACDHLLSVAAAFSVVQHDAPHDAEHGSQAARATDLCMPGHGTGVTIDTKLKDTLDEAKKLYSNIFDDNAKILGLIPINELFKFIDNLDPPSSGAPGLAEQVQYGAAGVTAGVTKAADDAVDAAKSQVILPLSTVVSEIGEGWRALDQELESYKASLPQNVLASISFERIFPELHCTLVALDAALVRAVAASDAIPFALATSEAYSAGRRFLDALFRAASDPGRRLEAAVTSQIQGLLAFFDQIDKARAEILKALLKKYLSDDAQTIINAIGIINKYADNPASNLPPEAQKYAELLVDSVLPAQLPILFLPPLPDDAPAELETAWRELQLKPAEARNLAVAFALAQIDPKVKSLSDILRAKIPPQGLIEWVMQAFAGPATIAAALVDQALAGITRAEHKIELADLPEAVRTQALANIGAYKRFLEAARAELATDAAEQPAPLLAVWLMAGFADEWRLITKSDRLLRKAIVAADKGDVLATATASVELLELHFGPLRGPIEICEHVLTRIGQVRSAFLPEAPEEDLLRSAGELVGNLTEWKNAFDSKRSEALSAVENALLDSLVRAFISSNGKTQELDKLRLELTNKSKYISDMLSGSLVDAKNFRDDLSSDLALLQTLAAATENLANGQCADLSQLKGLHRPLRALIDHRRLMIRRLESDLQQLVSQAGTLLKDDVVAAGLGAAALITLLNTLLGIGDSSDDAKVAKDKILTLKTLIDSYQTDAQSFSASFIDYLADTLKDVATTARDVAFALIKILPEDIEQHSLWSGFFFEVDAELDGITAAEGVAEKARLLRKAGDRILGQGKETSLRSLILLEDQISDGLADLVDEAAMVLAAPVDKLVTAVNSSAQSMLNAPLPLPDNESFVAAYGTMLENRNKFYQDASSMTSAAQSLLVLPTGRAELSGVYTPAETKEQLRQETDQLAGDVAWLNHFANGAPLVGPAAENTGAGPFIAQFLAEWGNLNPTPFQILGQLEDLIREILKGNLFAVIDFADLRRQVEDYILSLVPTKIDMSFNYDVELSSKVRQATMGIFAPSEGARLTIETSIAIDLLKAGEGPISRTTGRLDAFDVKLVGDAFDALTLKFDGAEFRTETGKKMEFDIAYNDYKIGPMLAFVEQFQSFLTPKGNSGFYLEPVANPVGIEAGYILNLGDFSIGAMAISNVGLATSAFLPFGNGEARLKAALSTKPRPFTITYTTYGGSGFFAIEANAKGIVGFEASFEFGGSTVFAFGPLSGQGRLMAGFYIRMSTGDNGQKLTEISATFFFGGTAAIWIFSFAAALSVRLGMVNGDMVGEATFSFAFSMGFADYEYSVTIFKQEEKGFNGQTTASLIDTPFGRSGLRFADAFGGRPVKSLPSNVPRIDRATVCQGRNWRVYSSYFDDDPEPEDIFA